MNDGLLLTAVQAQPPGAVTVTLPLPPLAVKLFANGAIAYVQPPKRATVPALEVTARLKVPVSPAALAATTTTKFPALRGVVTDACNPHALPLLSSAFVHGLAGLKIPPVEKSGFW